MHRAQLAAQTAGQAFRAVFLKFERADSVKPAEEQAAWTETAPESYNERRRHHEKENKNPSRIESYPEMQDEIENEEEILEITDSPVEFLAPFDLTNFQPAEKRGQQIKSKAYRTRICAPDSPRPQNHQPDYRQKRYQPPGHRMAIVHDHEYQSCDNEKIGKPDVPSDPLKLSWFHHCR